MFQAVTFGGEETIAKSCLDEQKPDTKACQADKSSNGNEVHKGDSNLVM